MKHKRFVKAGTHIQDREDPSFLPQVAPAKFAMLVTDKLNEVNDHYRKLKPIVRKPVKIDEDGLLHHNYRFGFMGNIRVLLCRVLGHRVSTDPKHNSCARCGLAYEEIYHRVGDGWFIESGIVPKSGNSASQSISSIKPKIKKSPPLPSPIYLGMDDEEDINKSTVESLNKWSDID